LKQRDIGRVKPTEMKFMRRITRCSLLGQRRYEDILEKLKVDKVENNLAQYKQK
jgi:hypothetical protein